MSTRAWISLSSSVITRGGCGGVIFAGSLGACSLISSASVYGAVVTDPAVDFGESEPPQARQSPQLHSSQSQQCSGHQVSVTQVLHLLSILILVLNN
jgi:hypothetical protein